MGTKQIQVSCEFWQHICTVGWHGAFECIEGLPEGATFCKAFYKPSHVLVLVFEHPDWPEIESDENASVIEVVWKKVAPEPVVRLSEVRSWVY